MVASSPGRVVSKINWRPLETTQPGEEPTFKDKSIVTISTLYACKLHSEISLFIMESYTFFLQDTCAFV